MKQARWTVIALATGLICLLTWWLPTEKPAAALGRFNYVELMLALATTLAFVSTLCIAVTGNQRRKRRAFQVASIWLGGLVALLLVEIGATLLPAKHNPFYLYNAGDTLNDHAADAELPFMRPAHIEWEGWSRGNIAEWQPDRDRRRLTFRTDADGFRNSTDVERAELVFIGDSFTEAGNVLEDESFASLTAEALGLKARNLGVAGYMPPAELVALERYGLKCEPQFVVWQIYEGNDLPESARYADWQEGRSPPNREQGTSRWEQWSVTNWLFRSLVRHERNWLAGNFRLVDGSDCEIRFGFVPSVDWIPMSVDGRLVHPGWKPIVTALQRGSRRLRQLETELIVVYVPAKITAMGEYTRFDDWSQEHMPRITVIPDHLSMAGRIGDECEQLSVTFVDSTAALRAEAADGQLVYYPWDTHVSPRGHEVISRLVVDAIHSIDPDLRAHPNDIE